MSIGFLFNIPYSMRTNNGTDDGFGYRSYISEAPIPAGKTNVYITLYGRDKMNAISKTIFSSVFSWMEIFESRLKLGLFIRVQWAVFQ